MNSENIQINIDEEITIKNKKRGDLSYYTISQVASLLDEEDKNILYYTNVFDNILNIEISDKELRYTSRDIDKLEFLINLKNKGMTIKEIQNYCQEFQLDIATMIQNKENKEIEDFKKYLADKINENNQLFVQKVVEAIVQEQNKYMENLKDTILNELKAHIDSKFDTENKTEENSLENTITTQLNEFNQLSISRDNNLINEIKKFKNVIEQAYYIQNEIQSKKTGFISKLFKIIHSR